MPATKSFGMIFFFAMMALLLIVPSCRSETEYHIDPTMGSDLNPGTTGSPFQSLNAICGRTPSERNLVIFDSEDMINLSQNCPIRGVWVLRCLTTCSLKLNSTVASLVVDPYNGAGILDIDGMSVHSEAGTAPTITLRQSDLILRDSNFSLVRPFVVLDAASSLNSEASEYSFNSNTNNAFYGFSSNGGKFNFTNSVFKGFQMNWGPLIRMERGSLLHLKGSRFEEISMVPASSDNIPKLISSSFSDVQIINSVLQNILYTQDSIDIVHPNLIYAEHGHATIKNTVFSAITFDCTSSPQCLLGSIVALLNDSSYLIEANLFHSTTSRGCTNLHLVESSGNLIGNNFYNATLNGRADLPTSRGKVYPPMSYPNIQGCVCLTRRLQNLEADFGSQLAPLGTSFTHRISGNTWDTINFPNNPFTRRDYNGRSSQFLLYGSDLWASNVALEIPNNNAFSIHNGGQVRFDACLVSFESAVPTFSGLNGLVDFGSKVMFKSPINVVEVRNLAIYGTSPTGSSKWEFESPGSLNINSAAMAIITSGRFHNVWIRLIYGSSQGLSLGRSFPETFLLTTPIGQPWPNIFSMTGQSGVETRPATRTFLQTITTPLVISSESTNAFILGGNMEVSKLSSPYAVGGARPATVKTPRFATATTSNVNIFDLCIEGDMTLDGSASIVPSMARNVFHGLNVTGTLRRSNGPLSLNTNFGMSLNAFGTDLERPQLPQPGQPNRIPFVLASMFDPPGFLSGVSLKFVNMLLKVKEAETSVFPQRIGVEIEQVTVTFQPRIDAAGFIGRFHLKDIRWMNHAITPNCSNLFVAPIPGMKCQWMTDREMLIWSEDVVLPENILDIAVTSRWSALSNPIPFENGPVFVPPTASMLAVPSRIRSDAAFWLDLSPSYHLAKGGSTPTVTWSYSGPSTSQLTSLLSANLNNWRWEVPASSLVSDVEYTFTGCIYGTRETSVCTSSSLTVYAPSQPKCDPPAIFLDVPDVWNVYESSKMFVRIIVDPACSTVNSTGPTRFLHDTSVSSGHFLPFMRILAEQAIPDPNAYGTQFVFNVTAVFASGKSSWASSKVTLRSVQHAVEPAFTYEQDTQASPTLLFRATGDYIINLPVRARWGDGIYARGISCPLNSFENFGFDPDPFPTYLPLYSNDPPCFNDKYSPALSYYPGYVSSNLNDYPMTLGNATTWKLGEYLLPVTLNFTQTDQQYLNAIKIPIKLIEPQNDAIAMISLGDSIIRASHSMVLSATKKNGLYCTDCTYSWTANNGVITSTKSLLKIASDTFGQLEDIPITLTATFPSGIVSTSRWTYRTSSLPFGGSFNVSQTSPGVFDMEASHWSTDYPPLQYQVLQSDCSGISRGRLVIGNTYSRIWKNVKPAVHGCSSTLTLYVTDGVGSIAHKSVSIPNFAPTFPQWTTQSLLDFSLNLTRFIQGGYLEEALQLSARMATIKDAPESEWQPAKAQFVAPFATSLLVPTQNFYHWAPLAASLFPDVDTLRRLGDTRILTELVRSSMAQPPYLSAFHSALWSTRFHLLDISFGALFGEDLPPGVRSSNIEFWLSGTMTHLQQALLPMTAHFRDQSTFPFKSEGTYFAFEWSHLDVISLLSTETASHRIGSVLVKPDMTKYMGEESLYFMLKTFKNRTHALVPANPILAPFGIVKSLTVMPTRTNVRIPAVYEFDVPSNINAAFPDLICVSSTGFAWATKDCTTRKEGLTYTCNCDRQFTFFLDVTLINPAALCPQPIPSDSAFRCIDGSWVLIGDTESPIITVPTGSSVVIIGNLTTDTIVFNGLSAVINITGCTRIGASINIELTQEELDHLLQTGEISSILIISTGCDISQLEQVPIIASTTLGNRCEKVVSDTKATSSTLTAILSIDKKNCKKSKWWIVLVSVLGAILLLGVIVVLLGLFTPLKYVIRPYSRRAEQANVYYYDDASNKSK